MAPRSSPPLIARSLALVAAFAALVPGCGSRSDVLGGLGGSGDDTGGSGDPISACTSIAIHEPVVAIPSEPDVSFDDYVRLARSSDDGERVTAVFLRQLKGSPIVVHHATFSPWTSWPSSGSLEPARSTNLDVDSRAEPGSSTGSRFGFTARRAGSLSLFSPLDPLADGAGSNATVAIEGVEPEFTVARAPGLEGATHLVGSFDAELQILVTVVTEGKKAGPSLSLGCGAVQPSSAGAVAFKDGWLVAVSNGSPTTPGCAGPDPDYPTRIDIVRIGADSSITNLLSIDTGVVVSIAVTPHPDGAYIVWTQSSPTGELGLRAARVNASSKSIVGPVDVQLFGETVGSFVAASMGRRLAVARSSLFNGDSDVLIITLHDEDLTQRTRTTYDPDPHSGLTTALGSPDGQSLLVGWTEIAKNPWRMRVARFDCAP